MAVQLGPVATVGVLAGIADSALGGQLARGGPAPLSWGSAAKADSAGQHEATDAPAFAAAAADLAALQHEPRSALAAPGEAAPKTAAEAAAAVPLTAAWQAADATSILPTARPSTSVRPAAPMPAAPPDSPAAATPAARARVEARPVALTAEPRAAATVSTTRAPRAAAAGTTPPTDSLASASGLPLLPPAQRPAWLAGDDGLVVDARPQASGGMLLAHTVLLNVRKDWGDGKSRPQWLRAVLGTNWAHAWRHGHAMAIRWRPTLIFPPPWQAELCDRKHPERERTNCWLNAVRENFNWEKHQMMLD